MSLLAGKALARIGKEMGEGVEQTSSFKMISSQQNFRDTVDQMREENLARFRAQEARGLAEYGAGVDKELQVAEGKSRIATEQERGKQDRLTLKERAKLGLGKESGSRQKKLDWLSKKAKDQIERLKDEYGNYTDPATGMTYSGERLNDAEMAIMRHLDRDVYGGAVFGQTEPARQSVQQETPMGQTPVPKSLRPLAEFRRGERPITAGIGQSPQFSGIHQPLQGIKRKLLSGVSTMRRGAAQAPTQLEQEMRQLRQ